MSDTEKILVAGQNVSKQYRSGSRSVSILDQADFRFATGSFTAVVGRSGTGKTTLLNLCGAIDRPDSGVVTFDGKHLESMTDKELAAFRNKNVGFVFQSFFLRDNRSALDNVMVPLLLGEYSPAECRQRAAQALEEVGLKDMVKMRVGSLSGGQKQRVAIARAIANKPRLILADEPTGSLDTETSREILNLLHRYNQTHNTTIIIVTHDPTVETFGIPMVTVQDGKVLPVHDQHILSTSSV